MNDRELLELAAKAAGIPGRWHEIEDGWFVPGNKDSWASLIRWDPLTSDRDAFRLTVQCNFDLLHSWTVVSGDDNYPMASICVVQHEELLAEELKESDPYAATRRAIVRAAAAIGKEMK